MDSSTGANGGEVPASYEHPIRDFIHAGSSPHGETGRPFALYDSEYEHPLLARNMPKAKWYSPQLRRDLVTKLYYRAQYEGIPMTRLADRLIEQALDQFTHNHEIALRAAEEPPTAIVPR